MAIRLLMYIGRVYEEITAEMNLFGREKLSIPWPEFIILYNGSAPYPDRGEREKALKKAIEWCIDHNILKDFLTRYGSEVVNMLMKEWTVEDFIKYQTDEERKIGRQKGRKERDAEIVKNALAKGLPLTTISEITGLSTKTIWSLGTK
jgi:hypothetical protein